MGTHESYRIFTSFRIFASLITSRLTNVRAFFTQFAARMTTTRDGRAERNWYSITELSDETPHDDTSTFKMTLNGLGKPKFYKGCKTVDDVGPATEIKEDSATASTTPSTGV